MTSGACSRLTLVLLCAAALCTGAVLGALGELLQASFAVPRRWYGRVLAVALLALLLAFPVAAQPGSEEEPVEVEVVEEEAPEEAPRWSAGMWCPISERRGEVAAERPSGGEGGEDGEQPAEQDQGLKCDAGVAASLLYRDFRQGRLSLVGVLGAQSLGIGGAWTFGRQGSHPLSVAVGVVMPYSGEGVFADEAVLAVGATVSVFGRR